MPRKWFRRQGNAGKSHGSVVVLTEFVSAEDAKKSKDVVEKIIQSLAPVELNADAGEAKRPGNAEGDELFALQHPRI